MVVSGTIINQRYRIETEIGRGGMGVVYCSHDTLLDRDVAIKVLNKPGLSAEANQRLLFEAKAVARLHHPNIVSVFDAGEFQGSPFIVIELLEGEPLSERMPRPVKEVILLSSQICTALDHAHTRGIVHRDLKPENVFLLPDGTVKLMDFGLARTGASRLTIEGEILGTVFYLAPEQALGGEIDHRVDLYALGVILYELLTGELPFVADDPITVITQHLNQPAPPPGIKNPQIPASLESLILRLLSKKKEDRPASAMYVLNELTRISEEMGLLPSKMSQFPGGNNLSITTVEDLKPDTLPAFLMEQIQSFEIEQAPFVCREKEIERLDRDLITMLSGFGGLKFITGDAGRGKTSLVTEFARREHETHPDLIVAMGSCNAITGGGDPFLPFRNILRMLTGDVVPQWVAGNLTRINAIRLWDLLPVAVKVLTEHSPNLIGTFVPVAGLLSRIERHYSVDSEFKKGIKTTLVGKDDLVRRGVLEQSRIFEEYTDFLHTLAEEHPLLLILEDLHWADASSLSLLFHIGKRVSRSKIFILGTYRSQELIQDWEEKSTLLLDILSEFKRDFGDIWIDLDFGGQDSARQFVDALLDVTPNRLSEDFRRQLAKVTEGHPLFTYELIKDLQERGDIFKNEDGNWVEGPKISWDILPAKVEGVIEKRIERLDKPLREVLEIASVEGETFTAEVISKVSHRAEQEIIKILNNELGNKHHLTLESHTRRIDSRRLSQYQFRHHLTQMYLYRNLGEAQRAYIHESVAVELEKIFGQATEEVALQLSYHFQEAGIPEKAVLYLYQAGVRALKFSAPQEAVDQLSKGLSQLLSHPDVFGLQGSLVGGDDTGRLLQIKIERRLGEAFFGLGDLNESLAHLEKLMQLLGKPIPANQIRLFAGLVWQAFRQVLQLVVPGLFPRRTHESSPYLIESVRAYYQLSEIYYLFNKPLPLIFALLTTLNLAETLEPTSELSWAYAGMGNVAGLIPIHKLAKRYIHRAKAFAEDLKNPYDQAYVKLISSLYNSGYGNLKIACDDLEKALEVFERAGDLRRTGETLTILAILVGHQGDLARSEALFDRILSIAKKRENELFKAWALVGLANFNLLKGEAESSVDKLAEARELLKKNIDRSEEIRLAGLLAKAYFLTGKLDQALQCADEGYSLITQTMPPTVFSMVVGYACVTEVYLRIWEMQEEKPGIVNRSNSELRRSADLSCRALANFSRVFRIGLTYKYLWRGLHDWLAGNHSKALRRWVRGLVVAGQLDMPYEKGLLHHEIACHLKPEDPKRDEHIREAEKIFSQLGASYDLARLNVLIDQS